MLADPDERLPDTLEELEKRFSGDTECAQWLEKMRWGSGFACPACCSHLEPYRFAKRPLILRCRACKKDVSLTAGTPLQGSHLSLKACVLATYSLIQNPTMSAAQLQRAAGIGRFDPASRLRARLAPMAERLDPTAATFKQLAATLLGSAAPTRH